MIEIQLAGRLGNNLFQYAVGRTIAEKRGYNFYIDPIGWQGGDLIKCDLGIKDGRVINYFVDEPSQGFRPEIFNIPDFTQIQGFWQTEKYFEREDVKKWFQINHPKEVKSFLDEYPIEQYCYINVRGTDQAIPTFMLSQEYYDRAINIILKFNDDLDFVVVTDDIELSKKYFPELPIYSNERDIDFCLFNSARFVISSISTFVWWATYLNDYNIVIAPRGWIAAQYSETDWMPKDIRTHKFIWT